jgi:mRNA-degrading endonuclease RelE of RelBE toxin-antitoxin system
MSIEQQVVEKLRDLPPEKRQEVLDFVDFLKEKNGGAKKPRRSLRGLWADLNKPRPCYAGFPVGL